MSDTRTIELGTETAADLEDSLASACCPMCGGQKGRFYTLCRPCWERTPRPFTDPLRADDAADYPSVFQRALLAMAVYAIHVPAAVAPAEPETDGGGGAAVKHGETGDLRARRRRLLADADALLDTAADECLGFAAIRGRASRIMQRQPFRSEAYRSAAAVRDEARAACQQTSDLHAEVLEVKRAALDGGKEQP